MEVLQLIRRCLIILGLCITEEENPNYGFTTNCAIVGLLTGFLMITVDFIITHFDDRADCIYAIMQFVTFLTVWTCYICFAVQKTATFHFINEVQDAADQYRK